MANKRAGMDAGVGRQHSAAHSHFPQFKEHPWQIQVLRRLLQLLLLQAAPLLGPPWRHLQQLMPH